MDVLSQAELDGTTGTRLAAAYDLLVFPGHHEYVTEGEYDAVEGFRDRGGNLMFLSANNFFWRIDLQREDDDARREVARARAPRGEPARRPVHRQRHGRASWPVARPPTAAESWIFDGVKLAERQRVLDAGIEIDAVAPSTPCGTRVLAAIPNLLGPG